MYKAITLVCIWFVLLFVLRLVRVTVCTAFGSCYCLYYIYYIEARVMVHVNLVQPIFQEKILSEIGGNETCDLC